MSSFPFVITSEPLPVRKPPKHPKRTKRTKKLKEAVTLEGKEVQKLLKRLKIGDLVKLTRYSSSWSLCVSPRGNPLALLESGKWVVYLESIERFGMLYHKIVYSDVVGYIWDKSGRSLRAMTKRQKKRFGLEEDGLHFEAEEVNPEEGRILVDIGEKMLSLSLESPW